MGDDNVVSLAAPAEVSNPLTDLFRGGTRRLIAAAVATQFEEYLSAFAHEQLPDGGQRVVRNGHLPERQILAGIGVMDVRVPKARGRLGSAEPFRSAVVPPYVRGNGQQGRRMANPTYTRFDNSSADLKTRLRPDS